jgi:hypothetical protein
MKQHTKCGILVNSANEKAQTSTIWWFQKHLQITVDPYTYLVTMCQ